MRRESIHAHGAKPAATTTFDAAQTSLVRGGDLAGSTKTAKAPAIAIQSKEVYERYMKYLTGCAELFRDGYTDLCQFTLEKG